MGNIRLTLNKNIIDLEIDNRLTFISGDSGVGKTYIVDAFYDAMKNPDIANLEGISPDKIMVCKNEDTLQGILKKEIKRYVIFIDRLDIYSEEGKQRLAEKIEDQDNTWIIISRRPDFKFKANPGFSGNSFKTLKCKTDSKGNNILCLERK